MHILVTNDDGVTAPGLLALAQEIRKLGKVTVFAPDRNWSASGHVKTMERPLRVRDTTLADGTFAFTSDGAPSDCVALPLLGLLEEKVDLVVSGINPHANIGHDITYSGTVTAAMEAVIAGVKGPRVITVFLAETITAAANHPVVAKILHDESDWMGRLATRTLDELRTLLAGSRVWLARKGGRVVGAVRCAEPGDELRVTDLVVAPDLVDGELEGRLLHTGTSCARLAGALGHA